MFIEFYIEFDALAVAIRKHTPLSKQRNMIKTTKRAKPAAIAVSSVAVSLDPKVRDPLRPRSATRRPLDARIYRVRRVPRVFAVRFRRKRPSNSVPNLWKKDAPQPPSCSPYSSSLASPLYPFRR